MRALCDVFRAARAMWPVHKGLQGTSVTIQIGQMKSRDINEIMGCPEDDSRNVWVLLHLNSREGSVELKPAEELNALRANKAIFRVIGFGESSSDEVMEGLVEEIPIKGSR